MIVHVDTDPQQELINVELINFKSYSWKSLKSLTERDFYLNFFGLKHSIWASLQQFRELFRFRENLRLQSSKFP